MKKIFIALMILFSLSLNAQVTNTTGSNPRIRVSVASSVDSVYGRDANGYLVVVPTSSISGGGGSGTVTSVGVALGTTGTDLNVSGSPITGAGTITINVPDASATARGVITTGAQTIAGAKTFSSNPTFSANTQNYALYSGAGGLVSATSTFQMNESFKSFYVLSGANTSPCVYLRRGVAGTYPFLRMEETGGVETSGYVEWGDAGSSGFYPRLIMAADNTTATYTTIQGRIRDAGTDAAIIFRASNQAGTAVLATAPLFKWANYTTNYMTMLANGSVGIGADPVATSLLNLSSTTQGFLAPRMTAVQRAAITSPATGLWVYDTDSLKYFNYNGAAWKSIAYTIDIPSLDAAPTNGSNNGVTSNGVFDAIAALPQITEGTYTPTPVNTTNIAASTAYTTYYNRVGDVVNVWGEIDIDPTTAATISELGLDLPITSSIPNTYQLSGTGSFEDGTVIQIVGDVTNNRAKFRFTPIGSGNNKYSFHFTYKYIAP